MAMIQQQAKMQAASKPAAARAVARPGFPAIQPSRSARSVGAAASMDRDVQSASAQQPEAFKPAKPLIDMSTPGMTRRQALQSGLAAMAFATCPCCPQPAKAEEWDYELSGPNMWEGVCAIGTRQSPVNLPVAAASAPGAPAKYTCKFGDITFNYGSQERVVVMNTGHGTMQVNFKPGNIATVGGVELELLQFHFHTPSEHAMDGKRAPMEVHLVHKVKATGGLAVLGIMIESGGAIPNPAIQTAFVFAPQAAKEQMQASRPVDPMVLLPADNGKGHRPYIHYAGSLTTPPCSEGVDWFVFTQPIKATDKQIIDFMRYVGAGVTYAQNSRPVQPINERKFKYEL